MIPQQMRLDDVSDAYAAFVDKFKPKKTTDDCYTPEAVYDAVCYWVESEYKVSIGDFVRPFWPGGDYERFDYKPEQIVVDNPPFSIITKICGFYEQHGIRYFLFAPHLTNFSIQTATCHVIVGVDVTYANGARINTAFVTNLDDAVVRTAPDLARILVKADMENRAPRKPVYKYPYSVITPATVGYLSDRGIRFQVKPDDVAFIRGLDAQKPLGKHIFGGGYLLSEEAEQKHAEAQDAAGRAKTLNQEAAEMAGAETIVFNLSKREREMQKMLGK